ncbi:glycosyltransferase family 2 protein [Bacillus sp. 1P06AnD]|uniref:glycosyltransferase family 2 protein n=1 Tax=Bacillus sp. 1P06AnD TaxID=3132208 RepID=UPI0039A1A2AF
MPFEIIAMLLAIVCSLFPIFHMVNAIGIVKEYKHKKRDQNVNKQGISILIPCYNESDILASTIKGIKHSTGHYANSEFIFINDGSKDSTLSELMKQLHLKPYYRRLSGVLKYEVINGVYQSTLYNNVFVIDKVNGGKADALNAGIDFAHHKLVVTLDADTILDKNALHVINSEFQDENLIAAGGLVNILQGEQLESGVLNLKLRYIIRFQILEYLKGFMILKSSLSRLNAMCVISGAFGVFRKEVLLKVGGYRDTVGEDIDITMKLQQYIFNHKGKKMTFLPDAICYTECPSSWKDLFNQRVRWQKAFVDSFLIYFKPMIKSLFKRSISLFFIFDAFLVGTLSSSFTLLFLFYILTIGYSDKTFEILGIYFVLSLLLNLTYTLITIQISKKFGLVIGSKKELIKTIIGELVFFRFVFMLFVMMGTILYFFNKDGWNKVKRSGNDYFENNSDADSLSDIKEKQRAS